MRVAVLGVQIPFARGGAELLAEALRDRIAAAGHEVDLVTLPFNDVDRESLLASCAAWRAARLDELPDGPVDMVIPTKFPSYLARHPNKVLWLVHQHRGIYDFTGTSYTGVHPDRLPDAALRETLVSLDRQAIGECRRVYTISKTVTARLERYLGIASRALYHPPPFATEIAAASATAGDGAILAVSRLERNKRIELLIQALPQCQSEARVRVVGTGSQAEHLRFLADHTGVGERVEFLGALDADALAAEYTACRAVFFAPFDEDYGYVTLEAMLAGKAVLTASDSGGVLEFVDDGATGLVVAPEPDPIAAALDRLWGDSAFAAALGRAARERVADIAWDDVVEELLNGAEA